MSGEKDYSLVTSKAGSVIAENLKVTLATPGGPSGLSPATITAMVGIAQNQALKIATNVEIAMTKLSDTAASLDFPANVQAAVVLSSLQSFQSDLGFGGSPNQAGFGGILQQAVQHCKDSVQLKQATSFLESIDYDKLGSGISDMGSMVERGMGSVVGDLSAAGEAMKSTGSMFNGIDVKDFGSPLGLVKALQANKLANATGVNNALVEAGVNLSDLDNPVYQDKIKQVMSNIKDPAAINAAAEQFNINNPFGGLPSYSGSDASLYTANPLSGAAPSITSTATSITGATSTASTAFGAASAPTVGVGGLQSLTDLQNFSQSGGLTDAVGQLQGGLGSASSLLSSVSNGSGIQSLADLSDVTKLADPGSLSGFGGVDALTQKFKDLGASTVANAQVASSFFSSIQSAATPLLSETYKSLGGLMDSLKPSLDNLTGSGEGLYGVPNVKDFIQHVAGGPAIDAFNSASTIDSAAISDLANSIVSSQSLFSTAGIDLTSAPSASLGSAMAFATNLKKFGQDTLTGVAPALKDMADTTTVWGESVKASLAEGANDKLFALNGMPPLNSNPFQGLPSDPTADPAGDAAKLLGG